MLDRSIAYTSRVLGVDGGIKERVPALTSMIEIQFHPVQVIQDTIAQQ